MLRLPRRSVSPPPTPSRLSSRPWVGDPERACRLGLFLVLGLLAMLIPLLRPAASLPWLPLALVLLLLLPAAARALRAHARPEPPPPLPTLIRHMSRFWRVSGRFSG